MLVGCRVEMLPDGMLRCRENWDTLLDKVSQFRRTLGLPVWRLFESEAESSVKGDASNARLEPKLFR